MSHDDMTIEYDFDLDEAELQVPISKPDVNFGEKNITKALIPRLTRAGQVLVKRNVITENQLLSAIKLQVSTSLCESIVDSGFVSEDAVSRALADQMQLRLINLNQSIQKPHLSKLLDASIARELQALVIDERGGVLIVAVSDPCDLGLYSALATALNKDVDLVVAPIRQLLKMLDKLYLRAEENNILIESEDSISHTSLHSAPVDALALRESSEALMSKVALDLARDVTASSVISIVTVDNSDSAVARLVETMFEQAMSAGASDIHIEPMADELVIRFRVDGVLRIHSRVEKRLTQVVTQRLKIVSNLDITERRLPQDGRFEITVRNSQLDVRISTMPSHAGESIVMRLLRNNSGATTIDALGMPDDIAKRVREILSRTDGSLVVTGPTGSGKTTTLYAAMSSLSHETMKIVTVEDPIEYKMQGIIQTQVNDKIGLTFARVMRSTLRQDPDVIMVGEIRDPETAEIAMHAAITGHLVLSTLHTTDAASTPMRLMNMGVDAFMVAAGLKGVIAQRLVRINCQSCSKPNELSPAENGILTKLLRKGHNGIIRPRKGVGCHACSQTGYSGRAGVYELLDMDSELETLAATGNASEFARVATSKMDGLRLINHAAILVASGRTTLSEIMRLSE